jgi:hypothetical protein
VTPKCCGSVVAKCFYGALFTDVEGLGEDILMGNDTSQFQVGEFVMVPGGFVSKMELLLLDRQ